MRDQYTITVHEDGSVLTRRLALKAESLEVGPWPMIIIGRNAYGVGILYTTCDYDEFGQYFRE